jgi:hypothetical protein
MSDSPTRLEKQANLYRDVYRMLIASGSDGVFFWWYPGGFRVGERSDFGIINPDGTDRPVTQTIRENGPKFLAAPKPQPDVKIKVDRNEDPTGLHGIYRRSKDEYWNQINAGHFPALSWKAQPALATRP